MHAPSWAVLLVLLCLAAATLAAPTAPPIKYERGDHVRMLERTHVGIEKTGARSD